MQIAYFINQYPKVSHSFIRREIQALEALNLKVLRFALRKTNLDELVDELDHHELNRTHYILSASVPEILLAMGSCLLSRPGAFGKTLLTALKLGLKSDRGVFRHLIYFVEACLLLAQLKKANVEHVHAHFGTNSTMVVMLTKLLGGPDYSFTVHGPEEFDKPEFIHLAEKIHNSRFVVAISSYGRSQLFRWIPAEEWHKVKVVHCGLDAAFIDNKLKKIPASNRQLLCVGRLCEQKGQLLLLDAMKQLKDEGVSCKLILAGDGPMREDIEHWIAEYKLNNEVEITGWISSDKVKSLLIESRGMVLASFAEGLPVVIMEALALGRPVISTYVAGIPELIQQGKNGWLVPPGDVDSLKRAIQELLNTNVSELAAMGQNGIGAIIAQHDIGKEANKLSRLFAEAVIQ